MYAKGVRHTLAHHMNAPLSDSSFMDMVAFLAIQGTGFMMKITPKERQLLIDGPAALAQAQSDDDKNPEVQAQAARDGRYQTLDAPAPVPEGDDEAKAVLITTEGIVG